MRNKGFIFITPAPIRFWGVREGGDNLLGGGQRPPNRGTAPHCPPLPTSIPSSPAHLPIPCPSVPPAVRPSVLPLPSSALPSPPASPPCRPPSSSRCARLQPCRGAAIPAPITMAPGLRQRRRWNSPGRPSWCRRGRAVDAATGGTRRQTGNEHRPSPLPAGADGSPRLRGRRGAGEGTEVTRARAGGGGQDWPLAPHAAPRPCVGSVCSRREARAEVGHSSAAGRCPADAGTPLGWASPRMGMPQDWHPPPPGIGVPPAPASLRDGHCPRMGTPGTGIPPGRGPTGVGIHWDGDPPGGHPPGTGITPTGCSDIQPQGAGRELALPGAPRSQGGGCGGVPTARAAPWPEPGTSRGPSGITGCGMTLPPPKISPGADSGKIDV